MLEWEFLGEEDIMGGIQQVEKAAVYKLYMALG